jgi:hypothetical protein
LSESLALPAVRDVGLKRHTETLRAVDKSLADIAVLEERGGLNVVPVLAGEGVDDLFLDALLSLGQALVLSNRHFL